jgi:exosortase/archaeosortase family protein
MARLWMPAAVALATWDAWRWYMERLGGEPEQGLVPMATIALVLGLGWLRREQRPRSDEGRILLALASVLLFYAATHAALPPIMRAGIAVPATLLALHAALFRAVPPVALWGLAALSLPVLPSLQFVLGYPLRVLAASLSVALLQGQGLAVAREGTLLVWQGRMVQFDAPCSGVNMLWAGLMLSLMVALLLRLDVWRTAAALALALVATIAANALRGASLFYVEAGIISGAPAWWHEAVGLTAFAVAAAAMLAALGRLLPRGVSP